MTAHRQPRWFALVGVAALVLASCGGDDDTDASESVATSPASEAPATTPAPSDSSSAATSTNAPATTEADGASAEPAPEALPGNSNCADGAGVTDDTIKIGAIVTQSGPLAGAGIPITAAVTTYWDRVNEDGGIAGRQVEIVLRDDEFTPAKTVSAFQEIEADVLAVEGFGTGNVSALAEQAEAACLVVMGSATSGSGTNAGPTIFTGVSANEVEIVNLLDWWVNEQGHAAPKVGVAYEGTPNGQGVLSAAKYAAATFGGEVVSEQEFATTDTSFSGQIAALQRDGADVIVVGAGNAVSYQFIAQAAQANADWSFLAAHSSFAGDVFDLPVGEVYQDRVYIGDGAIPNYADGGAATEVGDIVAAAAPDVRAGDVSALASWLSQELLHKAILKAVENGDLTRGTVLNELSVLETPSTFYPGSTQSFGTNPVFPRTPTSGSGIFIADQAEPGGKRTVVPYFVSDAAAGYQP